MFVCSCSVLCFHLLQSMGLCVCVLFRAPLSLPQGIVGMPNICLLAVSSRMTAILNASLADCLRLVDEADALSEIAIALFRMHP